MTVLDPHASPDDLRSTPVTLRFDLGEPYPRLFPAAKVGLWAGLALFLLGVALLDAWWRR